MSGLFKLEMAIAKAMGNKNYSFAIECYKELHEKRKDAYSLYGIANCYKKMGNLDKAIEYSNESLTVDENNFESVKLLVGVYHEKKQYPEAYDHVIKAINIKSEMENDIPFYLSFILKLLSVVPKFRNAEQSLKKSLQHNDEWMDWANEFKRRYENNNWTK
ncbi:MAG: hypothetical protein GY820_48555 [Gammaproteobacteria bacterium]|nr:hypothetical protein [Gammaproteobacteria bacterium]